MTEFLPEVVIGGFAAYALYPVLEAKKEKGYNLFLFSRCMRLPGR
jgi:hypothetical protein